VADTVVFRVLDLIGVPVPDAFRWFDTPGPSGKRVEGGQE
jgi:hypothetical protein